MTPVGVLVVGVSGQGVERAASILAEAALAAGREVQVATERPAARLGASVRCQVRFSPGEVRSPFVPEGEADLLLALERLEGLRWVHGVRASGLVAVADCTVPTPRMRLGLEAPAPDLLERLRSHAPRSVEVPAAAVARKLGDPGCVGAVLLGIAAPVLPIAEEAWELALRATLEGGELAAWRLAMERGRQLFARLPREIRQAPEPRAA